MNIKELFTKLNRPMTDDEKARQQGYVDFAFRTFSRSLLALILIALLMTVLSAVIPAAHAGGGGGLKGGATEITQLMNNAELALQTAEEQLQTIQQIEQTYLARLQQIGRSLGEYTAPFQRAYGAYQKIVSLQGRLELYHKNIGQLSQNLLSRYRMMAASKLDWGGYVQRERQLIEQGNQKAIAQLESDHEILVSTQESMLAYQKAAAETEKSLGIHQTLQLNGAQLSMLGSDLNKLIALTAQANASRAADDQERSAERERKLEQTLDLIERQRQQDKKTAEFIEALEKRGGR